MYSTKIRRQVGHREFQRSYLLSKLFAFFYQKKICIIRFTCIILVQHVLRIICKKYKGQYYFCRRFIAKYKVLSTSTMNLYFCHTHISIIGKHTDQTQTTLRVVPCVHMVHMSDLMIMFLRLNSRLYTTNLNSQAFNNQYRKKFITF